METQASYRDQISWACSAQSSEMLPKPHVSPQKNKELAGQKIKASAARRFEQYRAKYGDPKGNK